MNFFTATFQRRDAGLVAVVADVSIPLDTATLSEDIGEWIGRTITVGVRAESVTDVPRHEASPPLHGTVEFVEELGSEVIVHARVHGSDRRWNRRGTFGRAGRSRDCSNPQQPRHETACSLSLRPGDAVTLFVDPANIHCFDPAGPSLRKGARQ